jgi:hypothetical protein
LTLYVSGPPILQDGEDVRVIIKNRIFSGIDDVFEHLIDTKGEVIHIVRQLSKHLGHGYRGSLEG